MILYIASDHGGLDHKTALIQFLNQSHPDLDVQDLGTHTTNSVDYPDYAEKLAQEIQKNPDALGVLICGTGIGISIKANRYPFIRAALIHSEFTAEMAKAHNNANVVCIGGRTSSVQDAQKWVDTWLTTSFEGGRHQNRVAKLS